MYKFVYQFDLLFMTYNGNDKDTNKEMREKELKEFRSIFNSLRSKFTLKEMEEITGIARSNLSAYGKGKKNPSDRTIKTFYTRLKTHIDKLTRQHENPKGEEQASQVEEESLVYNMDPPDKSNKSNKKNKKDKEDTGNEMVRFIKANYDRLWAETERNAKRFDRILDHNNQLVNNNTKLADTTAKLAESHTELIATNSKLVNKLLSGLGS